ncbi:hypothetical protein JCM24511_04835 [Saitozyma sp. JCM 24511]|nr:hypothetical protein JCM24511_04835 [Saitozyma sp. JCM 24511]
MPNSLRTSLSPSGTTILSLAPVSAVPPHTLALALLSQPTGVSLVHLDLAPSPATETASSAWSAVRGSTLDLGEPSLTPAEMVLSQGAARGCLGLAAVISDGSGPMLLVPPKLQTSAEGGDDIHVTATDAATSIFLAIRQGVSYADVIRAAFGSMPKAKHSELAVQILQGSHDRLLAQFGPTDLSELFKLQTAVFSATEDRRRDLAAELLRLWEAGQLFIACKQVRDGSLSFDLDTVWPLINFAEWVMGVLSRTMRECILQMGRIDWEGDASAPDASRVIYVLHPHLRRMVISLLAAIHAFSGFVLALEDPILPPESRLGGMTRQRDPRATLVAKDRVRDLGLAQGMEVMAWGKALEGVNIKAGLAESDLQTSLVTLDISPILPLLKPTLDILPSPSSLFRAEQAEVQSEEHDAITFLPIPQGLGLEGRLPRCDRCGWRTAGLAGVMGLGMGMGMGTGMGAVGMGMGMGQINGTGQETTAWEVWKKEREAGCGCGGTWVR